MARKPEARKKPLSIARQGFLFAGGAYSPRPDGRIMAGQAYFEYQIPARLKHPFPLVMIHGGGQTGTNFTQTPDGREGWAQFFLRRGYAVYVMDQVGRGRSVAEPSVYGPSIRHTAERVAQRFTDTANPKNAPSGQWPQARRQRQWPGTGRPGDPAFDRFYASQVASIADPIVTQAANRDAVAALLDEIGPAVLFTHSQSGTMGWLIGDKRPKLVKGIVAAEPGAAVAEIEFQGPPDWFTYTVGHRPWGLAACPLKYSPAVADPSELEFVQEAKAQGPGLARVWKQREPARRLVNLAGIPVLIVTGEASFHSPYDHGTSQFLTQAGVANTHIRLADIGIRGNGHMLMSEKNSDEIAGVIHDWLKKALAPAEAKAMKRRG